MALSQAESNEKIDPRSSLGTNLEVIERSAGATIGLKMYLTIALNYF